MPAYAILKDFQLGEPAQRRRSSTTIEGRLNEML